MPPDPSEPQRAPDWPEIPPTRPESGGSPFTPTVRSFMAASPHHAPEHGGPEHSGSGHGGSGYDGPGHGGREYGGSGLGGTGYGSTEQRAQSHRGPDPGQAGAGRGPDPDHRTAHIDHQATRPRPHPSAAHPQTAAAPPMPPPPPPPPDDPYKPFVTAGQISGPKTPPAHRQQELWNTVFGENYDAIDEYEDDEGGRPVWLFALGGSVLVALVGVLVWAFVAGPLSSSSEADADPVTPSAKPSQSVVAKPQSRYPTLPKFKGTASPVNGTIADQTGRITVPRLGGKWQLDPDGQTVQTKYGFAGRQHVQGIQGAQEAELMWGPLSQTLAAKYTTPDKLGPVVNAVAIYARQALLPKGNKATKIAQQKLTRNGKTGLLSAYKITSGVDETTIVVAALDTGGDLPAVVYMAVPGDQADLLPDVNTVFRSIRPLKQQ
ncbi:hypothetical protein [Sphaerimonospora mesophila]|uniref:hypothetical protein n=1 Tax=Sphaerimonospora mesophila TaxID=37483 RepID=UPI0009F9A231